MDYQPGSRSESLVEGHAATLTSLPPVTPRNFATVDMERYASMLNDSNMTDGEKIEFVTALWTMLISLSDLDHSTSECSDGCEAA